MKNTTENFFFEKKQRGKTFNCIKDRNCKTAEIKISKRLIKRLTFMDERNSPRDSSQGVIE